jgi:outer membrane protein assembly factor BamB
MKIYFVLLLSVFTFFSIDAGSAWNEYKYDSTRSNSCPNVLKFPMVKIWSFEFMQKPKPAWSQPGREAHRMDFDYCYQPVSDGNRIYLGSSADDSIYALDMQTGGIVWSYTTGGPVRFAPAIYKDNVFAVSDDGFLYCLESKTGALKWKFLAAPSTEQLIGNNRIISRHPLRSGLTIKNGII